MALTESNDFEMGKSAPDFQLLNTVSGKSEKLYDLKGEKGTVIMFICNHCPFVIHINEKIVELGNKYLEKGINFIAISSNDIDTYPQDGPEKMKEMAESMNYPFPYLFDDTQQVAKAYDATCTPDLYLFDDELKATYHGQLDDSRPGNGLSVSGIDLVTAIDTLLFNGSVVENQKPSIGCNIKWR